MKMRRIGHWAIFAIWLVLSAALIITGWNHIRLGVGWDPDDQLRLVQLRDFLNGQGWFDNRQYRLSPPEGAPMHWSRLIELPLAVLVLLSAPLVGQVQAETVASIVVPLFLFGGIILLLSHIASHIGGPVAGIIAAGMAAISGPLVTQLRPMRIDHHGWQIAMAVLALASLFHANARKAGLVLGVALAVWLHISLEAVPMSAAFFLFLGWQWLTRRDAASRLFWTITSFSLSSLVLFLGTQTQGFGASVYCDTVSPPHIWAILAASICMLPGLMFAPRRAALRALIMLSAGAAAVLVVGLRAPACLTGAFGTLDPLVRAYWYVHVQEGMPIWHQPLGTAAILLAGPVVGLVSSLYLAHKMTGQHRQSLIILSFFTLCGFILSLLVLRTVSVASAYAIVPAALLVAHVFAQYRQENLPARRILCVVAMLLLASPASWVSSLTDIWRTPQTAHEVHREKRLAACESAQSVAALGALPIGQFIAPFDMAPMILARTKHSVLASGHHRNAHAMRDHIEVFRSPPQIAHLLLHKRGIDYVAVCADEEELADYARKDPNGLWAHMAQAKVPNWLEPLPVMGKAIRVWRVR
ncbi:MAG: hypothetical protein B7Y00_00100 [Sphingomonadales bacterium 17-56-6]|nr:MAG: hypothetical protein B7Y44_05835 [Sphingomonadales bacterium 28-55-16]OYZ90193.1 MAG: hypothetical protein B7Y00_00100 [Sphingomonadales bacterium 17-56-6]